jgi:hypothetical protein
MCIRQRFAALHPRKRRLDPRHAIQAEATPKCAFFQRRLNDLAGKRLIDIDAAVVIGCVNASLGQKLSLLF